MQFLSIALYILLNIWMHFSAYLWIICSLALILFSISLHILFGICGGMVGRAGAPLSRGDGGSASGDSHIKLRRKEVSQVTIGSISFAHTHKVQISKIKGINKKMSKYYISEGRRLARPLLDPSLLQSPNMKNQKIKHKNVKTLNIMLCLVLNGYICICHTFDELCTTFSRKLQITEHMQRFHQDMGWTWVWHIPEYT